MSSNITYTEESLDDKDQLRYASLARLTGGIPQHELQTIINETIECEVALEKEIQLLEDATKGIGPITSSATIPNQSQSQSQSQSLDSNQQNQTQNTQQQQQQNQPQSPEQPRIVPIAALPREYDPTSKGPNNYLSTAKDILKTELTPLDRYFTLSSLLGRLRDPLDTPLIPQLGLRGAGGVEVENPKKKNKASNAAQQSRQKVLRQYKRIVLLKQNNEIYTQIQTDNTALLALVKRISNHRTAAVFRRAVNPKEAPGYEDRILYPVDMALIKKLVLYGHIHTFERLHQYIGMVCHNCVKFNGRYSDYALLTKDFEAYVDDSFLDFMQKQKDKAMAAAAAAAQAAG